MNKIVEALKWLAEDEVYEEFSEKYGSDLFPPLYLEDQFVKWMREKGLKEKAIKQYVFSLNYVKEQEEETLEEDEEVMFCDLDLLEEMISINRDLAARFLYEYQKMLSRRQAQDPTTAEDLKRIYSAFSKYKEFLLFLMETSSPLLGEYKPKNRTIPWKFGDYLMLQDEVYLLDLFEQWLQKEKPQTSVDTYKANLKRLYTEFFYHLEKVSRLRDLPRLLCYMPEEALSYLNTLMCRLNSAIVHGDRCLSKTKLSECKSAYRAYIDFIKHLIENNPEVLGRYDERELYNMGDDPVDGIEEALWLIGGISGEILDQVLKRYETAEPDRKKYYLDLQIKRDNHLSTIYSMLEDRLKQEIQEIEEDWKIEED